MAQITGLSSGQVDVTSVVNQLMVAERIPIDRLNKKSASFQTQLSVFGGVRSNLSNFQSAVQRLKGSGGFQAFKVSTADSTVLTATAGSSAVAGNYAVEISSLAQSQQLIAAGQASATAQIGAGATTTLNFDFGTISYDPLTGGAYNSTTGQYTGASFASNGGGIKTVTIDSTNNTLQGIRDAVNAANIGVTATIINDGGTSPFRLAFSSTASGVNNSMSISVTGDAALSSLLSNDPAGTQNLAQTLEAKNANFKVNGVAITKSSNVVTDAIQGVTLNLNKVTTAPNNLSVVKDTGAITSAANSFITAYNDLIKNLTSVSAYKTATSSGGSLAGDTAIRQMIGELKAIISSTVSGGTYSTLSDVGIKTQPSAGLALDATLFDAAVTNNLTQLSDLFTSSNGFATQLEAWAKSSLNVTIANRTGNISQNISEITKQVDVQETRMVGIKKRYTTQFSNLNTLLQSLTQKQKAIQGMT